MNFPTNHYNENTLCLLTQWKIDKLLPLICSHFQILWTQFFRKWDYYYLSFFFRGQICTALLSSFVIQLQNEMNCGLLHNGETNFWKYDQPKTSQRGALKLNFIYPHSHFLTVFSSSSLSSCLNCIWFCPYNMRCRRENSKEIPLNGQY